MDAVFSTVQPWITRIEPTVYWADKNQGSAWEGLGNRWHEFQARWTGAIWIGEVIWMLGAAGENCSAACTGKGYTCDPSIAKDFNKRQFWEQVKTETGIDCQSTSVQTWNNNDQPCYVTAGNDAQKCLGVDSIPSSVQCDVATANVRRWCKCESGAGLYQFKLRVNDGGRLSINNAAIIEIAGPSNTHLTATANVALTKGWNGIKVEYYQVWKGSGIMLDWKPPGKTYWHAIPRHVLHPYPLLQLASQTGQTSELLGRLEVLTRGLGWGGVCDAWPKNTWNRVDAEVTCRELGLTGGQHSRRRISGYSLQYDSTATFHMGKMQCAGTEMSLSDCPTNLDYNDTSKCSTSKKIRCWSEVWRLFR
jgi:hypothetical protein